VTAGGVLFIGATVYDRKFRAFDSRTASCSGRMSCRLRGCYSFNLHGARRQYVVIAASGGRDRNGQWAERICVCPGAMSAGLRSVNLSLFLRLLWAKSDILSWQQGRLRRWISKGNSSPNYDRETTSTRKVLDAIPADVDFNYKPHPKSMSLGRLADTCQTAPAIGLRHTLTTDKLEFPATTNSSLRSRVEGGAVGAI